MSDSSRAASAKAAATSPADLTFEQARDQLVEVVRSLETGGVTLDEALATWERGESLADRCHELLDAAQIRLDRRIAESS
ncbi:MAG: exodeoxyribonuclease VII small subunit [Nocardioides sp.]